MDHSADKITENVERSYEGTPDPRLREILTSLVRHSHAFIREVRLTEAEWMMGVDFLTRTGQKCDDKRQEMILLSDSLGISALVNTVSAIVPEGATETTVVGPFYVPGAPDRTMGQSILLRQQNEEDEPSLIVRGRVVGMEGEAIGGARIEVWQTDSNGMYNIQDENQPEDDLRGTYYTDEQGRFTIRSIRPSSYPIPIDGPVGELLRATRRHPWRPAHLHATITAPGYKSLTTHLFDAEDEYLQSDAVFAVKESLVREFVLNDNPEDASRHGVRSPFFDVPTDFVLQQMED